MTVAKFFFFGWLNEDKMQAGEINNDAKRTFFVSTVTVLRPQEHDSSLKPLPVMQASPKKR